MPKKIMKVEWDDGTDLSQSQKTPGAHSPLVRDGDNNLVGHVVLHDVDEDEDEWEPEPEQQWDTEEEADVIGALIVIAVVVAAHRAAPHIKRWWTATAAPFLRRTRERVSNKRRRKDQVTVVESSALAQFEPTNSSQEVLAALEGYRASMSSTEARERFVSAVVARLFSEAQLRVLRSARIEDAGTDLELASAMKMLSPHQVEESITAMLEANPSWPNDETLTELGRLLQSGSLGDPELVPLERRQPTRALRQPPAGN